MKKIHVPALSTAFSEDGKKAKKRFENIQTHGKKRSVFLICFLLASIIAVELLISCSGKKAEKIGEQIENTNLIIGGADEITNMLVYDVPVATVSTDIRLYLDKNLMFQNRDYLPYPERRALALAYPTENENIFFVSVPAFVGGLYGYADAKDLNFLYSEDDFTIAQILEDIPDKNIISGETIEILERKDDIYTIRHPQSGEVLDVEKDKIGIGTDKMRMYPAVYNYIEKELKKLSGDFDNIMLDSIGFFFNRCNLDSDKNKYEVVFYAFITYTDKYTDEETLTYIRDAIESKDMNRITYDDEKGVFKHGMLTQMSMKFSLDFGKIDESTLALSYNNGQLVTNMPIPTPSEEWIDIKSIGEIFPEKLYNVSY